MKNKQSFISQIQSSTALPKDVVETVVEAFLVAMIDDLKNGVEFSLRGVGSIKYIERPAYKGINPKTREPIAVDARRSPRLTFSNTIKAALNGKGEPLGKIIG